MDASLHWEMQAEYERMAEDIRSMQARLGDIRAGARSGDGLISAVVGGSGELLELRLDPRIYRAPDSAGLARAITDTIHLAARRAHDQGLAIAARFLPDGTESADLTFGLALTELDRVTAAEPGRDRRDH